MGGLSCSSGAQGDLDCCLSAQRARNDVRYGLPWRGITSTPPDMSSQIATSRAGSAFCGWRMTFTERVNSAVRRVVVMAAVLAAVAVAAWVVLAVVDENAWFRGPALATSYGAPTAAVGLAAAALWAYSRDQ